MAINQNSIYSFLLSPNEIDKAADHIANILSEFKAEKKTIVKIRLLIEDLLMAILRFQPKPTTCKIIFSKRSGNGSIRLQYEGDPFDPLTEASDDFTTLLFENLGVPCSWKYQNRTNILTLSVRKQKSSTAPFLLGAIAAAIILGLCSRFLPAIITETLSDYLLIPFKSAFLKLLNAFAGILIFFSIISGMCSDSSAESFRATTKKLLIRQPLLVVAITIVSYLALLPFSGLSFGSPTSASTSQAKQVSDLIWGIIPGNVLTPFTDGNYIQIVLLAFIFGISLSAVRDRHPELVTVISSINSIIITVTGKLCRFIPLFIFCSLFTLIRSPLTSGTLLDIWKPVVMFTIVGLLITVLTLVCLVIRFHCNSLKVLRVILPAFLIALTTGSPAAAYSTNLDILEGSLGVSKRFSRVGLAISSKLYLPGVSLYLAVMVIYFAEKYQTPINVGWVIIAIILTIMLTYACPPIPSSFLVIFGIIAKQCGFPDECMVLLATADIFLDGLSSALCCILRNIELLFEADDYHELNRDTLRNL